MDESKKKACYWANYVFLLNAILVFGSMAKLLYKDGKRTWLIVTLTIGNGFWDDDSARLSLEAYRLGVRLEFD
jgi:hypothetical protein